MSLVAGNNININDSSTENTEANKKHHARDQSSSATPWSLTPSHCCFYKLTTLPLKGAVFVNKSVHACVYRQSLFLPLFIYTYTHTHIYIVKSSILHIKTLPASKHRVLLQRPFPHQWDSSCRTERSRTGKERGPTASVSSPRATLLRGNAGLWPCCWAAARRVPKGPVHRWSKDYFPAAAPG